jgi:Family of unknown function (DUF5335)
MPTRTVPRPEWPTFLESFSRRHRAWLATVEQSGEAIGRVGAAEAPLGSVTALRQDKDVSIEIAFTGDGHVPLRIEKPRIMRVRQTDKGTESGLEIVDDDGVCTRVGFRVSARPEMLDGVAPGEV